VKLTNDDLDELELLYEFCLPISFRKFMLSFPEELDEIIPMPYFFSRTINYSENIISEHYFINNKQSLIEINNLIRDSDFTRDWINVKSSWQNHFFVIGEDKCHNYYFINTNESTTLVWRYSLKTGEFEIEANNLHSFKEKLLFDVGEIKNRVCAS